MKALFIILLSVSALAGHSQDMIRGSFYDLKTGKQIRFTHFNTDTPRIYVEGTKARSYAVNKDGNFVIPANDITSKKLTLSTMSLQDGDLDNEFADIEIKNIPADSLQLVVSKVFLTKAYYVAHGGSDNFLIDSKRTFSKSSFIVDNGTMKYLVKRYPEHIERFTLAVKYLTDLDTDILK